MAALAFDTHSFVKKLTAAGFSEQQAEVLAQQQAELIGETLATKQDLKELETASRRDLKEVEAALRRDLNELEIAVQRDLAQLRADLVKWMAGLLIAQGAVIVALVKLI